MPTLHDDSLQRITEEMYKQNRELAVRNKTLNVIQTISTVANQSFHPAEVGQLIVNTLVGELHATLSMIAIVHPSAERVECLAMAQLPEIIRVQKELHKNFQDFRISLHAEKNSLANAVTSRQRYVTDQLSDIFEPWSEPSETELIQQVCNVTSTFVLPLTANSPAGVLVVGFDRKENDLSAWEEETLEQVLGVIDVSLNKAFLLEDLRQANVQLKEMDSLKDEFLAVASHELRTPMTAIKGYIHLLLKKKDQLSPDMEEKLSRIAVSSERMLALVGEMLDVSRIAAGRIIVENEAVDVSALVREVGEELRIQADEKGIRLEIDSANNCVVHGDKNRLHEVVLNIIDNGIKYTPNGGRVSVSVCQQQEYIAIIVADTGVGIAEKDVPKLFTKFGRFSVGTDAKVQASGSGLGLYICHKLVELMKGKITVKSTFGKGSIFTVTLPVWKG